jgi:Spy/CpxP family protein refolding chaperone
MVKFMMILLITFVGLYAKSTVDACIPIGKIVILKKSIMSLELDQEQKKELLKYEEKLKDELGAIKDGTDNQDEKLSSLFDDKNFLRDKFVAITTKENIAITRIISEYFENMYRILTPEQRVSLIKRFKRIEKKKDK